jgi:hypothetical protein
MKNRLVFIVSAVFAWVVYVVVGTSLESNLFEQWDYLMSIPWMKATLWDFYASIFVLLLWVYYKESHAAIKALWTVLFITLGSIAVTGYLLLQLMKLNTGDGIENILLKNK